jgi:hypothetical protein
MTMTIKIDQPTDLLRAVHESATSRETVQASLIGITLEDALEHLRTISIYGAADFRGGRIEYWGYAAGARYTLELIDALTDSPGPDIRHYVTDEGAESLALCDATEPRGEPPYVLVSPAYGEERLLRSIDRLIGWQYSSLPTRWPSIREVRGETRHGQRFALLYRVIHRLAEDRT